MIAAAQPGLVHFSAYSVGGYYLIEEHYEFIKLKPKEFAL